LEIGKLGDLHSIEPDLPTQAPRAECGRLPIVFDEPDIMVEGIDAKGLQAVEIDILNLKRRRFHDDLVLVIVLKPVGILAISTIGWTTGGFHIGDSPWFRA
jgi:hypothetical protein